MIIHGDQIVEESPRRITTGVINKNWQNLGEGGVQALPGRIILGFTNLIFNRIPIPFLSKTQTAPAR
jgi:hypothetical protein